VNTLFFRTKHHHNDPTEKKGAISFPCWYHHNCK